MHIKPGEQPQAGSGRQSDSSSGRKLRLGGGASRVPVQSKPADSPFQALVSAIGQSFGTKSQVRNHTVGPKELPATRTSLFASGSKNNPKASSGSTPTESKASSSLLGRSKSKEPAAAAATATRSSVANSLKTPSTPVVSRVSSTPSTRNPTTPSATSRIPSTPSATSRLSSNPSASRIPSTPSGSRIPSTPSASRVPLTPTSPRAGRTPILTKVQSTPASSGRLYYTSARVPATPTSKVPSTPSTTSRLHGTATEKSSRRNSLSSAPSSSISSSGKVTRRSQAFSTPPAKSNAKTSAVTRAGNPTTPVSKNVSAFAPKTPKAQNDPTTPASKISSIFTPRRPGVSATSASRQRHGEPRGIAITPVSKQTAVTPGTPIHGVQNDVSTPISDGTKTVAFYTPSSSLPLTPLQPKNFNLIESSRKLLFGQEGAAAGDQENVGCLTPKPHDSSANIEPTFTFDKNRLAQIRARRGSSQLLKSPAQRVIRVLDTQRPAYTPARGLQQVDEDRSARFDEDDGGGLFQALPSTTPGRRRLANSLF